MAQADKEDVQVAPVFADCVEPTSAKSSRCQYTAKQKQRAVLYAGARKYYSALIHVLGALLIEVPLGHYMHIRSRNPLQSVVMGYAMYLPNTKSP